jgi:hypothetical protein
MDEPLVYELYSQWHRCVDMFVSDKRCMHLSVKLTLRLGFPHHKMPKDPQKTTALIGWAWKRSNA